MSTLWEEISAFGDHAFIVTIGGDGRPHAVSTSLRVDHERIVLLGGSTSKANAAERPTVMLMWPPVDGGPYSLLVDGDATLQGDDTIEVTPTSAVLHRVAGADTELPSCVRLLRAP